jgi:hypothetical protein
LYLDFEIVPIISKNGYKTVPFISYGEPSQRRKSEGFSNCELNCYRNMIVRFLFCILFLQFCGILLLNCSVKEERQCN